MTFSNVDSKQECLSSIRVILARAEAAERELSYISSCGSEQARKDLGSYYTPIDVARFFWNEFFCLSSIDTKSAAETLIIEKDFVEPSVGAGALFFALLEKFTELGVSPNFLSKIHVDLIDINEHALSFVKKSLRDLEAAWSVKFEKVKLVHDDFRSKRFTPSGRPKVFFGNPPFVTNQVGQSQWKNLYADFIELALDGIGVNGAIHFIVPLSLAFSRDYASLRKTIVKRGGLIALSSFDNIPDTLFKSGKPLHENSNKANSQRCSIVSILPSTKPAVVSTQLHRWSGRERNVLLTKRPKYHDITDLNRGNQIIRPKSSDFLNYYRKAVNCPVLGDMEKSDGKHVLNVATVARNFIGIREAESHTAQSLEFENDNNFMRAFIIVTSDVFMDYWLSIGDGFHLTRSNLGSFPINDHLRSRIDELVPQARRVWTVREHFAKEKLNSGSVTKSFDFSGVFPSLYETV
jgi:methylase of polypeptide subunit release factors